MSKEELKNKAQQLTSQPGKVANFCYKVFMSIMVSLCLLGIKSGGSEVKDVVAKPIADFKQLKVDRDSSKVQFMWIASALHKQDSINHTVTDSLIGYGADINELMLRVEGLDLQMGHKEDK